MIFGISPVTGNVLDADTLLILDGKERREMIIAYPDDLKELHRREDEREGWPPLSWVVLADQRLEGSSRAKNVTAASLICSKNGARVWQEEG